MVANVELVDTKQIQQNPDNPRLIFRISDLEELESSIAEQGILVPLTLFKDGQKFVLLDGERRWRCATKLGLQRVPAIVQPKPERMQNIMMMFAIHNARRDWDPLPTALKLKELESELQKSKGRKITEAELAASSSLSRGAVRRYRKIQKIPVDLQKRLLRDAAEPSSERTITVDHVIEAIEAAESLSDARVIEKKLERSVVNSVLDKFSSKIIPNTVAPRKIVAVGRAVSRGDVSLSRAQWAVARFIEEPARSIDQLVASTIESVVRAKALEKVLESFEQKFIQRLEVERDLVDEYRDKVERLITRLRQLL